MAARRGLRSSQFFFGRHGAVHVRFLRRGGHLRGQRRGHRVAAGPRRRRRPEDARCVGVAQPA
eukprot:2964039-Lingulodinium_polyedra.AAC.1